jgi:hypothetical protein
MASDSSTVTTGWQDPRAMAGVPYHERFERNRGALLPVYVPGGDAGWIAPGSGIVGASPLPGEQRCYVEGWLHGAHQYEHLDARGRWEAAVRHAAGRALTAYPTVALGALPDGAVQVGQYRAADDQVVVVDEQALTDWLR